MSAKTFSADDVKKIALLANIPMTAEEQKKMTQDLQKIITLVDTLGALDTKNVTPTSQVTGLENVFREDIVDEKRTLTQEEALSNAQSTHNGYFVVEAIFEE